MTSTISTVVITVTVAITLLIFSSNDNNAGCVMAAGGSANGMGPWGGRTSHNHNYFSSSPRQMRSSLLSSTLTTTKESTSTSTLTARRRPSWNNKKQEQEQQQIAIFPRGGYSNDGSDSDSDNKYDNNNNMMFSYHSSSPFVRIIGTITQLLISMGKAVLPPVVATVKGVIQFYRALPIDAITAQIGLVYCFLGGYYPTLFSSLQAARFCGWHIMVDAIADLTDEAIKVIDEMEDVDFWEEMDRKDLFLQQTNIVLKTVDPMKINQAAGALYTTWLGVSTVLQREYARTINLSLTLAEGIERVAQVVLVPPLNLVTPRDYHKWVPAVIGWTAKGMAMRIAWRIERVLTASTSAIAGGAMFARSVTNMIKNKSKKKKKKKKKKQQRGINRNRNNTDVYDNPVDVEDDEEITEATIVENVVGFAVGSLGFYTQMECQYKKNFAFKIPFPISLVTWPFDLAERWIQWYITKYNY